MLLAGITACGGNADPQAAPVTVTMPVTVTPTGPDLTKCRAALTADYVNGWSNPNGDPWPPSTRMPVCAGIDRPTLQRLMDEAVADAVNGTPGPG